MEIMELSGQKRVLIGQKRAKKSVYHLKNVIFRLRDVEVASSNLVTSTIKKRHPMGVFSLCLCVSDTNVRSPTSRTKSSTIERYAWSTTAACGGKRERDKGINKENRNRQGARRLCL